MPKTNSPFTTKWSYDEMVEEVNRADNDAQPDPGETTKPERPVAAAQSEWPDVTHSVERPGDAPSDESTTPRVRRTIGIRESVERRRLDADNRVRQFREKASALRAQRVAEMRKRMEDRQHSRRDESPEPKDSTPSNPDSD